MVAVDLVILAWFLFRVGQSTKKILAFSKENPFSWNKWRFLLVGFALDIFMVCLWIYIVETLK